MPKVALGDLYDHLEEIKAAVDTLNKRIEEVLQQFKQSAESDTDD